MNQDLPSSPGTPIGPQDAQQPLADPPNTPSNPPLPTERYEIALTQHGKYASTTVTLPHETQHHVAMDRAHEALLGHPPGTEVAIYRHTLVLHSRIDEHRQIHRVTPE